MITVNELFSGIGAQVSALRRLGISYNVVGISEIDKYAIKSYEAMNGSTRNYGDICKIPMLDYADLWTYSFPCTDISTAGKQAGITSETRSGLLLEVERLLECSPKPKYLLLENVKNLVGKKFKPDFDRWLKKLESLGYNNYWQILNAKNYGVPQNRERVFVVSIRKDVDTKGYKFPQPVPLIRRLKDVLELEVAEKYYLKGNYLNWWNENKEFQLKKQYSALNGDVSICQTARQYASWNGQYIEEPICIASRGRNPDNPSDRTTGSPTEQRLEPNTTGCINTLTTVQKDNYVMEAKIEVVGNIYINSQNAQSGRVYNSENLSPALDTCEGGNRMPKIINNLRIRKLTPLECWRLMGFSDFEFFLAKSSGISDSQLYKQAGNSIVVDVLMGIFRELFNDRL